MFLELAIAILILGFVFITIFFAKPDMRGRIFLMFTGASIILTCGLVIFTEGIHVHGGETTTTTITTNSTWYYNGTGWKTNQTQHRNGTIETATSYTQIYDTNIQYTGLILCFFALGGLAYAIIPKVIRN